MSTRNDYVYIESWGSRYMLSAMGVGVPRNDTSEEFKIRAGEPSRLITSGDTCSQACQTFPKAILAVRLGSDTASRVDGGHAV